MVAVSDIEHRVATGQALSRDEAERACASLDLPTLGSLGEAARKARHGTRVTFVRVLEIGASIGGDRGDAGEVRLTATPSDADDARAFVREAVRFASGVPVTGFSLAQLLRLAGEDHLVLADIAAALKGEGLEAVAEVAMDEVADAESAAESLRALAHGGLGAWRATIQRAPFADRIAAIECADTLQRRTQAFKTFAPLPRVDPADQPSTGYDDVRTIAVARLMASIPSIQVDWPLYGPKLAQVAITFGADDIDGVGAQASPPAMGHRRTPVEEIQRHIRMAFAEPIERNGRFEIR